jgi:hypothetical protein
MTEPMQDILPEYLKNRLLSAGVEDEASLQAALEADPDLRVEYEHWLISTLLQAFAATTTADDLAVLATRTPILLEPAMIGAIEDAIAAAQARGDEKNAVALAQRLGVLREIKVEREAQSPELIQAVLTFVQAPDEQTAIAVFFAQRSLLATEDAEAFLISHMEPDDKKAREHLEQRLDLLHRLRLQAG